MWKCKVCSKEIEDDEKTCYFCGSPEEIQDNAVSTVANDELVKLNNEVENLPKNEDKYYEIDYTSYKRDILNVFSKCSFKIALLIYSGPIFGIFMCYHYILKSKFSFNNISMGILGLIIALAFLMIINSMTKVYSRKRKNSV